MSYLYAFLFCGFVCGLSQFFLEKTKLTPGHINTSLVIIGCVLSGFKIYDVLVDKFSAGAVVPIMNFGHLLVSGASDGFKSGGFVGLFKGVFTNAGAGISVAILSGFIVSMIFKIKD